MKVARVRAWTPAALTAKSGHPSAIIQSERQSNSKKAKKGDLFNTATLRRDPNKEA